MSTKTIRIPLTIDHDGNWRATGGSYLEEPGEQADWLFLEEDLIAPRRMWVTVDVEIPTVCDLAGTATEDDGGQP